MTVKSKDCVKERSRPFKQTELYYNNKTKRLYMDGEPSHVPGRRVVGAMVESEVA